MENHITIVENNHLPDGNKLMLFVITNCPPCRKLEPIMQIVGKRLLEESIQCTVYKINGEHNQKLAQQYNIKTVPQIILQLNNENIPYSGFRDEDSITDWVREKVI